MWCSTYSISTYLRKIWKRKYKTDIYIYNCHILGWYGCSNFGFIGLHLNKLGCLLFSFSLPVCLAMDYTFPINTGFSSDWVNILSGWHSGKPDAPTRIWQYFNERKKNPWRARGLQLSLRSRAQLFQQVLRIFRNWLPSSFIIWIGIHMVWC